MSSHQSKSGSSHEVRPRFNSISPITGQAYIAAAQRHCLMQLSEVVSIFHSGVLPIEMLEFPLPWDRRKLIARKAGAYYDENGHIAKQDQTAADWRAELIVATQTDNADCSEEAALELLFPHSGKKSRESKRQAIASQSLILIQSLNLLWPSEAISLELIRDQGIKSASEIVDLIAWQNAFTSFCLNNSGNAQIDAEAAKATLESTVMKGQDIAGYIKAFKIAATNVKLCKANISDVDILGTLFRNLNQSDDMFHKWNTKHLDASDPLHAYMSKSLEDAISHIENYFKKVILPSIARKKAQASIQSVSDLKQLLGSHNNNTNSVNVPIPVLALYLKNNNNNNNNNNATKDADKKRKAQKEQDNARKKQTSEKSKEGEDTTGKTEKAVKVEEDKSASNTETLSKEEKKKRKQVCYAYEKGEKCRFGSRCYFRHSA